MTPTVVDTAELDALCGLLGLTPPGVLRGGTDPGPGDVRERLTARGLLHGRDPAGPVAADLGRLARAPLALELRRHRSDPLDAVAAVAATRATLAVRRGDRVTLQAVRADRATEALLALLGPLRPARGRPVRVPVGVLSDALAAAGDDPRRLVVELMRRGMTGAGARTLVAANRDVDMVVRIGVTLRANGGPRPGAHQLTVQHNAAGHHCQRPHAGPPEILETAPATAGRLTREVDELVRASV